MDKPDWWSRPIFSPANETERDTVRFVQRVLGVAVTGDIDEETRKRILGLQYTFGIPRTGILDLPTAIKIDGLRNYHA